MVVSPEDAKRKELEILRALSEYDEPVGSTVLRRDLRKRGFLLSDRTIRYHLQLLDAKGFTEGHARSGRTITRLGLEELGRAMAYQRVGFVMTRFLSMAYEVTYRPENDGGRVVANVALLDKGFWDKAVQLVKDLKAGGFLTAPYIKILDEEETYKEITPPRGKIALFTVCNLTIDGVLMHAGIPMIYTYGGLVQYLDRKPTRFVELISYEGTTVPPLEVFVYRGMTSITRILRTGSGMLLATLREMPAEARDRAEQILGDLGGKGWGGVIAFGQPNEPILGIPVGMDRFGISMVGGVSPIAALREIGANVDTFAPHSLVPLEEMTRI